MTPLFEVDQEDGWYYVTEHFPEGKVIRARLSSQLLVDNYIRDRTDMRNLGHDAAIAKWKKENDAARRKAGLPVRKDYSVLHYGNAKKAACGFERGVTGTIRQEVLGHTMDRKRVSCRSCLAAMEKA
jgi:hypothetical protein